MNNLSHPHGNVMDDANCDVYEERHNMFRKNNERFEQEPFVERISL